MFEVCCYESLVKCFLEGFFRQEEVKVGLEFTQQGGDGFVCYCVCVDLVVHDYWFCECACSSGFTNFSQFISPAKVSKISVSCG